MIKKQTDSCSLNLYRFQKNLFCSDAYFLQSIERVISTILILNITLISTSEQSKCHIRNLRKNLRHAMYISAKKSFASKSSGGWQDYGQTIAEGNFIKLFCIKLFLLKDYKLIDPLPPTIDCALNIRQRAGMLCEEQI